MTRTSSPRPALAYLALIACGLLSSARLAEAAPVVLVQFGSSMTYLANSSDPGIGLSWTSESFDDSAWPSGSYGVGYETSPPGVINLLLPTVPAETFSVYTRARFTVDGPGAISRLLFGADYDDGYVAWINGVEVARSASMPAGSPAWNTNAGLHESSNGASPGYGTLLDITSLALPALHAGENVLAVGVWNSSALTSSDLVLVPLLAQDEPGGVTRGPYLQMATPASLVVRWRTDVPMDSRVLYGTDPVELGSAASDPTLTTEHSVALAGLFAATRYYYAVGSGSEVLAGGDPTYSFITPIATGTAAPTRVWVVGDSGTANAAARAVRDAYAGLAAGAYTNLWLMLGDNAYPNGTDLEYQAAVFDMYPELLRQSVLWPTLGNHDGHSADSATQTGPYYDIFTLPRSAEAGGLPSGTEAYYSFDYVNIHFICLESYDTDRSPAGAMMTWLQQDVLSTDQPWIIAFWHHPPYTKGSHNSDLESELIDMRTNALPILEQGGVDLVLTGHSHSYERSFLIDGHYGSSTTFNNSMKKDGGDGRIGGSGAYRKPSSGPAPHEGAVYVVAGSSGQTSGGTLNHPAMYVSLNTLGSLVLDVNGPQLDARFLDSTGTVRDYFTLFKGPGTPPAADFTASPSSGTAPLVVQFADRSAGDPSAWAWDFENDGTADSLERNPTHNYAIPGLYTVRLTSANAAGSNTRIEPGFVCALSPDGSADVDGDGFADGNDDCPCVSDPGQLDTDLDGTGDACDADDDNDGAPDGEDCAPFDQSASAPPGDLGNSLLVDPAGTLIWSPVAQATAFNVYRGGLVTGTPFTYNHACFESHSPDAASPDPEAPAIHAAYYYFVSAWNVCGEGSLGSDSTGQDLPNPSPCP